MYKALFFGGDGKPPFAEPYVVSFCSIDKEIPKSELVAKHGLLSQWRGYGNQGGYAIIFDTAELQQLLIEENKKWDYPILAGDVVYSSASDDIVRTELGEHINVIVNSFQEVLKTNNPESLKNTYIALCQCACQFKHWGFIEEREVRIVVIPTPPQARTYAATTGRTLKPGKPVEHFLRSGTAVPYLNLFEGITSHSGRQLPIKRIIVGPHPDQIKRKTSVETMLNHHKVDAEVTLSEIPYLG